MTKKLKIIADLHLHSKYSRATSQRMDVDELAHFAKIKGLNLLGTGDITFPAWFKDLKQKLKPMEGAGLLRYKGILWMLTVELSTVYEQDKKVRKVHHLILMPSFEIAEQITERLKRYGRLDVDGRPVFNNLTSPELVEILKETSKSVEVIPAHCWTPWYGVFGSKSGFDSLEECYQDMTKYIFALETGLSSDPPMNWRLSALDKYALVSNSDAHSPWPWRIGREANVFELPEISYDEIIRAIREKDSRRFKQTIEVNPAYGKYHWTGHRKCGISVSPREAIKLGDICPVCKRRLTEGVEERVEKLADRPPGFRPEGAISYVHLLPLHEIIASVLGIDSLSASKVWSIYNSLISKFGNEFHVLLDVKGRELSEVVGPRIAEAILRVRKGKVKVIPGYDGVYGEIMIFEKKRHLGEIDEPVSRKQVNLERFM